MASLVRPPTRRRPSPGRGPLPEPLPGPGRLHHGPEELVDPPNDLDELLKVDRFRDVGIGVQVVAAQNVLIGLGCGEDDDGDRSEPGSPLISGEDLAAVLTRRIQVGQDRVGPGCTAKGAFAA